ncbi:DUF2894 domain-containing protein [Luteimonas terricola]|uniref:DUF2894 domain-containing protein n=1 Tax=Luteimonas terricola TaxID=645597 RepID=A0ABQ2EKE2_9GAMM|nr:DUF2894 domain-containing protein [Luteimonas terricola]GGK14382.1 hypothetical protein GCM10011394_24520 [Luteimonas terricola]
MADSVREGVVPEVSGGDDGVPSGQRRTPSASALGGLLGALEQWANERDALAAAASLQGRAAWPELPALQGFRALWAGLRMEEQVRRALAPAPAGAGPLNSSTLVHRTLVLMREESPGYLRHFTAYVDALACLQDLQGQAMPSGTDAPAAGRKRAKGRARAARGTVPNGPA